MDCDECNRLERLFLESMVFADRAQSALRCCFLTHRRSPGVSDLDEYESLRTEEERTAAERHLAYKALAEHGKHHT